MYLQFIVDGETKQINGNRIMSSKYVANAVNTSASNAFGFGSAASRGYNCSISNHGKDWWSNYLFEGKEYELYHNDGTKIGVFTVDNAQVRNGLVNLSTTDNMKKFNVVFKGGSFPCTVWELLLKVCNQCDVDCGILESDLQNGDCIIKSSESCEGLTCRDIVKAIAEVEGGYAIMNCDGKLVIKHFSFESEEVHYKTSDIQGLSYEEIDTKRTGVAIIVGNQEYKYGDMDYAYLIENNTLINYMSESDIAKIGQNIKNNDNCFFRACSFEINTNSALDVGDFVKVDTMEGNTFGVVIGEISITNNYVETIKAIGDSKGELAYGTYSTYKSNNEDYVTGDGKVRIDRERNNLRFYCKGGEYTLCTKSISEITKYSKVHAFVKTTFTYNSGSTIRFRVYANNILIDEFPYVCPSYSNTFSFPCYCDIPDSDYCDYKLNVVVEDGCLFTCDAFKTTFSFITYSAKMDETMIEDKYIVEEIRKVYLSNMLGSGVLPKTIANEHMAFLVDKWDISKAQNGTVMAYLMSDGVLYIYGDNENEMQAGYVSNNTYAWYSDYKNFIKKIVIRDCYDIAGGFVNDSRPYGILEEVSIGSTVQVIADKAFNHNSKPNYIVTFEDNVCGSSYIGERAFYYGDVVADNLYFSYEELASVEITNEIVGTYEKIYATAGPTLGDRAFQFCENLTGTIQFRAIKEIPYHCFEGCSKLWGVFIIRPVSVPESDGLGGLAFDTHITLGWAAFLNCENLGFVMCDEYNARYSDFTFDVVVAADGSTFIIPDWGTFYGCPNIDRVFAPGVEELGTFLWGPRNYDIPNIKTYEGTGQLNFGNDNGDWDITLVLDGNTKIATDKLEAVKTNMYDFYRFTDIVGYTLT